MIKPTPLLFTAGILLLLFGAASSRPPDYSDQCTP